MATMTMPTLLSSDMEQDTSSPLSANEDVGADLKHALREKIQEGFMHLVEEAQESRDTQLAQLESQDSDEAKRAEILQRYDDQMKSLRRLAEEQFQQMMACVRQEREWTEGAPVPVSLIQEQQAILDAIKRQQGLHRRQPSPRARSSSDASSMADSQRGEQSAWPARPDDGGDRPPGRSQSSYARQPPTPSGSIRGGAPLQMSGISAYFSTSPHGGVSEVDLPELGREGVSRRPSKASLGPEIWRPPAPEMIDGVKSRAFVSASADPALGPPPTRRDSIASSAGRLSRSGSVQSNGVPIDPDFPSSAHVLRGKDVPEEPSVLSVRAREKQREAQPLLGRPVNRRNDDRPVPSPGWSQYTSDAQFPFSTHASGGADYSASPTERRGIPINGTSRASSVHRGSPESLRHNSLKPPSKNSWPYDSSPVSAGFYVPQSLQSNLVMGNGRTLATKRSFTVDDDLRSSQANSMTRMWSGPKGRRDSTGSHSLRSQRSRQDMYIRQGIDGSALSPLPSDESVGGVDGFDSNWDDAEYGLEAFERREHFLNLERRIEELRRREEAVKRREEDARRKEEDAKRKEEDAGKKEEGARRREEDARVREQKVREAEEQIRKLEDDARQLENRVNRREDEARKKEAELRRRERDVKHREETAAQKEEDVRSKEEEVNLKAEEARRKEDEIRNMAEEVSQRAGAITVVETELVQKEEELRRKESRIQRREQELESKELDLRSLGEQLNNRESTIRAREQQDRVRSEESQSPQAGRRREDEEHRRREEEARQGEPIQRARRAAEEAQEAQRIAEERRRKEDFRRQDAQRREETQRQEAQRQEQARQREAAQRKVVEAEAQRRAEAAQRESAERRNGGQHDVPAPEDELVFDTTNPNPDLIREQEALFRKFSRGRNNSLSSDGSPRSATFASATSTSQTSSPRSIPGRAGSTASSASADRNSTASSSSYGSTSGFSSFSGHSSTSTYSQASSATTSSTPTPSVKQTRGGWKPAGAPPTSATNSQQPLASAPSLPPPTPQEEEEWKRRQREHARQQAERFQRMQEQAEQERYARSAKQLSKEEVMKVFEEHERRWSRLSTLDIFTWYSFPWPVLQRANSPEELTVQAIHAYVLSPHNPNEKNKLAKDLIKDYIKRWHPDRFETKFLPKVRDDDREKVKEGAGVVARNLNELLTRQSALNDFAT